MGHQALAVDLPAHGRLQLRFGDVHLDAEAVPGRKIAAGDEEFVGAVMRDGRPEEYRWKWGQLEPTGEESVIKTGNTD